MELINRSRSSQRCSAFLAGNVSTFLKIVTLESDYRREPMLNKTKTSNEKILMNKTKTKGFSYKAPEKLSKSIHDSVREKKERDAEIRAKLTA